ncbi:MAG: hypothetical protein FJ100_18780 [Deltaproteobacteria bacterium]|nr:hypothetical protein [Deltaproteobacteria bacterium]
MRSDTAKAALCALMAWPACSQSSGGPTTAIATIADAAPADTDAALAPQDADGAAPQTADALAESNPADSKLPDTALPSACTGTADGTPCDDGDPCTQGTHCVAGTCSAGQQLCACQSAADCAKPGADLCLGKPFCDLAVFPYQCKLAGGPVACPATGNPCQKAACNPATGACESLQAPDGTACPSLDPCAVNPVCQAGACTPLAS